MFINVDGIVLGNKGCCWIVLCLMWGKCYFSKIRYWCDVVLLLLDLRLLVYEMFGIWDWFGFSLF